MDVAVLCGLLIGDICKVAGNGVIGLTGFPNEVQGNHGELGGCAALEEQNLVALGDIHQAAELCLGIVEDLLKSLRTVTHFHD